MNTELALQKVEELRQVVEGDETAELVDTLATLLMLRQDVSNPMLGAKVTLHLPPEGEWVDIDKDEYDELPDWRGKFIHEAHVDEGRSQYRKLIPEEGQEITEYGTVPHQAIVFEGNVGESAPEGDLWDPNEQEYRTKEDYPMGTVNVIVAQHYASDELITFTDDYPTDVEVFTSITPAKGEPNTHQYTPGW